MIKNKTNVEDLLTSVRNFTYVRESIEIDVSLKEEKNISVRYNTPNCFIVNFMNFEEGVSALYKDRKYLNREIISTE